MELFEGIRKQAGLARVLRIDGSKAMRAFRPIENLFGTTGPVNKPILKPFAKFVRRIDRYPVRRVVH